MRRHPRARPSAPRCRRRPVPRLRARAASHAPAAHASCRPAHAASPSPPKARHPCVAHQPLHTSQSPPQDSLPVPLASSPHPDQRGRSPASRWAAKTAAWLSCRCCTGKPAPAHCPPRRKPSRPRAGLRRDRTAACAAWRPCPPARPRDRRHRKCCLAGCDTMLAQRPRPCRWHAARGSRCTARCPTRPWRNRRRFHPCACG